MAGRDLTEAINRVVEGQDEAVDPEEAGIRIPIPQDPEVNPEVFRDVERLLFRGFLTLYAEVNGVAFVFKSMNHHEFDNIQLVTGGVGLSTRSNDRYFNAFIAHGVFMVDGQNILPERGRWLPKMEETFAQLPPAAKSKIVRHISEVNRKASDAVTLTEAFNMEPSSRFRWAQLKGLDLMATACTGIEGTSVLGMNFCQLVWRALNYFDDLKEQAEREWDTAKFVGGCFVGGKEIRKIHNHDQERRTKEKEDRIERRDKLIRQVLLREDPDAPDSKGPVRIVARTVGELATQLERDLRGEKDWHDEVVAREEARIKEGIRQRQQKLKEMSEGKGEEGGPRLPYSAHTETAGLTREEVQQRILRRRQLEAQQSASKMVYPEMMDPRMGDFMQKYMDPDDTYQVPGSVQSDTGTTDRDTSEVRPLPPSRPRATPFRR